MFDFEKFPVYQLSQSFYSDLYKTIFSIIKIDSALKNQLRRASSSITLNIAEGAGKYSPKDKRNFYTIARGSINECMAILGLIKMENLVMEETYQNMRATLFEMNKMLSGLITKMNERVKENTGKGLR